MASDDHFKRSGDDGVARRGTQSKNRREANRPIIQGRYISWVKSLLLKKKKNKGVKSFVDSW